MEEHLEVIGLGGECSHRGVLQRHRRPLADGLAAPLLRLLQHRQHVVRRGLLQSRQNPGSGLVSCLVRVPAGDARNMTILLTRMQNDSNMPAPANQAH